MCLSALQWNSSQILVKLCKGEKKYTLVAIMRISFLFTTIRNLQESQIPKKMAHVLNRYI